MQQRRSGGDHAEGPEGRAEQVDEYEVLRRDEMPRVEVHIVRSGNKPGGIGEPGVPPIGGIILKCAILLRDFRWNIRWF